MANIKTSNFNIHSLFPMPVAVGEVEVSVTVPGGSADGYRARADINLPIGADFFRTSVTSSRSGRTYVGSYVREKYSTDDVFIADIRATGSGGIEALAGVYSYNIGTTSQSITYTFHIQAYKLQ